MLQPLIHSEKVYGVANHSRGIRTVEAAMAHPDGIVTPQGWAQQPMRPAGSAVLVTKDGAKRLA